MRGDHPVVAAASWTVSDSIANLAPTLAHVCQAAQGRPRLPRAQPSRRPPLRGETTSPRETHLSRGAAPSRGHNLGGPRAGPRAGPLWGFPSGSLTILLMLSKSDNDYL